MIVLDVIWLCDQMSISSVDELAMFSIWNRVDPRMTNRKMPNSQGPT